jgi:hypothetical protein
MVEGLMARRLGKVIAYVGSLRRPARFALLGAVLCVGALANSTPVIAQASTAAAPDLPADAETKSAVSNMLRQGVMQLRQSGEFSPSAPSTLGEYLISLQKLFHLEPPAHPVTFTDVPPDSPYYAAAQAAAPYLHRQALCMGCALSTNLYPEQPLTRAQSTVAVTSILNARGALPLLDEAQANQVLEGVGAYPHFSPLARRLVATGVSGGVIPLSDAHPAQLTSVETRASTATVLNAVQTKFQLPEIQR